MPRIMRFLAAAAPPVGTAGAPAAEPLPPPPPPPAAASNARLERAPVLGTGPARPLRFPPRGRRTLRHPARSLAATSPAAPAVPVARRLPPAVAAFLQTPTHLPYLVDLCSPLQPRVYPRQPGATPTPCQRPCPGAVRPGAGGVCGVQPAPGGWVHQGCTRGTPCGAGAGHGAGHCDAARGAVVALARLEELRRDPLFVVATARPHPPPPSPAPQPPRPSPTRFPPPHTLRVQAPRGPWQPRVHPMVCPHTRRTQCVAGRQRFPWEEGVYRGSA